MIPPRFKLAIKILPIIIFIIILKFLIHYFNFEFLPLSSLFTAVISANIFLIGFLLSGVLSDYKESEKIPADIASSIETMADEGKVVAKKNKDVGREFVTFCAGLSADISNWFQGKKKTGEVIKDLEKLNDYFVKLEEFTPVNYIARMKSEQHFIRKTINRAHTIKDTDFIGGGYAIAEIITIILIFGFIFIKIDPFYESMFFVTFVSFMLVYMIHFIKDLDNPFGYGEDDAGDEVSLKPFEHTEKRLKIWLEENK